MADRETIMTWLEKCDNGGCSSRCPYDDLGPDKCYITLMTEAIALLKEQETIEPDVDSEGTCSCGNCGTTVGYYPVGCSVPEKLCKYCPECGHGVKWK